jgi:hypothetical protein
MKISKDSTAAWITWRPSKQLLAKFISQSLFKSLFGDSHVAVICKQVSNKLVSCNLMQVILQLDSAHWAEWDDDIRMKCLE